METSNVTTANVLEDRISEIERQMYGIGKIITVDDPQPESNVIENLLHVHTLISSAVTGREKANAAIKRLPELNTYIDATSEESDLTTDAKKQYLLAIEPEIQNSYELLTKMQELMPVLDTDRLQEAPQLTSKLNELNLLYLNTQNNSKALTENVLKLISKYNSVINIVTKNLIALDAAVTAAEIAAMPKKQLD
ncbi:dynactin subunit 3 [Prorops nasuta]|uniref:dynactin subunit 3 n=1 Tax=Prorops nasuta TaxID=863751 RepID=UPI0034CD6390